MTKYIPEEAERGSALIEGGVSSFKPLTTVYLDVSCDCVCAVPCLDNKRPEFNLSFLKTLLEKISYANVKVVILKGDIELREDLPYIVEYVWGLKKNIFFSTYSGLMRVANFNSTNVTFDIIKEFNEVMPHGDQTLNAVRCGAGHSYCHIFSCGNVTPCSFLPIKCGNIWSEDLLDIWNFSPFMKMFRSSRYSFPGCEKCVY